MKSDRISIAVLSDIHSNYIALKACLSYIRKRGINTFIFLGDYLADMAYPQKTMELLRELQKDNTCYFIRGNKEDYWLNYKNNKGEPWKKGSTGALLYTYEQLTEADFEFFESIPIVRSLSFKDLPDILVCHGSPFAANENMRPDNERTYEIMEAVKETIILCGHTHIQNEIVHNGKVVLNGGAVGVPYGSEGKTQFMILYGEEGEWKHEFVSLEYDREKVVEELIHSELYEYAPYWCTITANLVRKGSPSHGNVLMEAMRLCEEETGSSVWSDIPDKFWEKAIKNLII